MGELNYNYGTEENKYLYQGKELQDEHNLQFHDFGARMYDAQLGRWHSTDPAMQYVNPYLAMGNNPVSMVDPDGRYVGRRKTYPAQGKQNISEGQYYGNEFGQLWGISNAAHHEVMDDLSNSTESNSVSGDEPPNPGSTSNSGSPEGGGDGTRGGNGGCGNSPHLVEIRPDGGYDIYVYSDGFEIRTINLPEFVVTAGWSDGPDWWEVANAEGVNYNNIYAGTVEELVGKPYKRGADGPNAYDCSGTACYGIRKAANSKFGDYTAHDLYSKFSVPSNSLARGTVKFYDYNSDGRIDHITTILNSTEMLHPSSGAGVLQIKPINYLNNYTNKRGGSIYFREFNWSIIIQ